MEQTVAVSGEDGIRNEKVIITERDAGGRLVREVEVERITEGGRIRQTTVREGEYDEAGAAKWETPRAVDPDRATAYVEECYERGSLTRPGS